MSSIRPPQPLELGSHPAESWKIFKQRWENYAIITKLDAQAMSYQIAMFLHVLGDDALKVFNGFQFPNESPDNVEDIITAFDVFAIGIVNETYERYLFNKRCQEDGESFDSFLSAVRILIRTCNYCKQCIDSILRDRIVLGVKDPSTQTSLLKERSLTLESAIDICKAAENASQQYQAYQAYRPEVVSKVSTSWGTPKRSVSSWMTCKFCCTKHRLVKEDCPAWGKTCMKCKKSNHFARSKMCSGHKETLNCLDTVDDEEWICGVTAPNHKDVKCRLIVGDDHPINVTFLVDTGATVNILPITKASAAHIAKFEPTNKKLTMWNKSSLTPMGSCRTTVKNPKNGKKYSIEFIIVAENLAPLISLNTAQKLNLLTIEEENVERVAAISTLEQFENLFSESIGSLPGTHRLRIDDTITPTVMASRRIPLAI